MQWREKRKESKKKQQRNVKENRKKERKVWQKRNLKKEEKEKWKKVSIWARNWVYQEFVVEIVHAFRLEINSNVEEIQSFHLSFHWEYCFRSLHQKSLDSFDWNCLPLRLLSCRKKFIINSILNYNSSKFKKSNKNWIKNL